MIKQKSSKYLIIASNMSFNINTQYKHLFNNQKLNIFLNEEEERLLKLETESSNNSTVCTFDTFNT